MKGSEKLDGRVAIITGGSRGIGREVALALAKEGVRIVVAAKSEASTDLLPGSIHTVADEVRALGSDALPYRLDVRDDSAIAGMVAATMEKFGRIDILVNNAGALWWKPVLETPMKRYDLINGVNSRGSFACTQAVLPHMIANGWGHILVYSPPVDLSALPGKVGYLISKFGMTMLAHGLAEEMRGKHVAINALWPVTAIESQATINFGLGGPAFWRKASIMADSTLAVVTRSPDELTGRALLDEDFLREVGVDDFAVYRCDPNSEPPRLLAKDLPSVGGIADVRRARGV
ncbi:MAG: SDR family oxidoreductase [Deltaproteobacteria bacterium]|nr:SDR family oxidoreductase [Deltaproteobacteria bacterium]